MPPSQAHSPTPPIPRSEWLFLAAAILFGAVLRLGLPGRMAVEHFDEGVYASNFWFGADAGYQYPARYLYAPPLLPAMIEWTMIIASLGGVRPTGLIPMLPSLAAGVVTIPSLWWIGRRWFGPTAGLVAAWLAATSDFHATYSRTALTDVTVGLFILWGTYFVGQALTTGTRRDLLLGGLITGLAWWTKYNGWLPLAVGLAGGAAWQMTRPRMQQQLGVLSRRWLLMAGLAFLIWSPVLIGLQRHGGYAGVAANHRQYVVGPGGWYDSAMRQLTHAGLYDAWLGPWTPALVAPLLMLSVSLSAVVVWLTANSRSAVAGWLLAAWIGGLSVMTPFYHPYPRLILPWLIAVWLGIGLGVQLLAERWRRTGYGSVAADHVRPRWVEIVVVGGLVGGMLVRLQTGTAFVWRDRSAVARSAETLVPVIQQRAREAGSADGTAIVYVYGEPAMVFTLMSGGLAVGPVQNLEFMDAPRRFPTFLVWSTRALRSDSFRQQWGLRREQFEAVAELRVAESPLVRLDEHDGLANLAAEGGEGRGGEFHLFQLRP